MQNEMQNENPPIPPGSTGCESVSGSPLLPPTFGSRWCRRPPPVPPPPRKMDKPLQIYDIGTDILYFQCFVTTDMVLFCKPIFFSGNCRIYRDLAFGSVKTRFKAILKKLFFSAQIDFSAQNYFFNELLPPEGD